MQRYQKIALIIGFIIVVFGIGFLLYAIFFKPLVPDDSNNANTQTNGGFPQANENQNIQVLTNSNSGFPQSGNSNNNANSNTSDTSGDNISDFGPTKQAQTLTDFHAYGTAISSNGQLVYYYNKSTGKFYSIDKNGNVAALSDKAFHKVEEITWSPDKNKVVLEYPDGANIVYDFKTKQQVSLPNHWEDFGFSPEGDKIISKTVGISSENNFLISSDASGKGIKILRELGDNADSVIPLWSPNNQMVGVYTQDAGLERQEVFFIGQNNENYKSMFVEGSGFQGKWTPQGDRIIYSVYSDRSDNKPELWLVDATSNSIGRNRKQLKIQTWADKCAFYDNNTLFCAVPMNLDDNAGYFPQEMDASEDIIYKINISTGSKSVAVKTDVGHTMRNLIVSPDGKYVYFTDKFDGKLYKVPTQ